MGGAASCENKEEMKKEFLAKLAKTREENPGNLCAKHLTDEVFNSFSPEEQEVLYRCAVTGVDNPTSGLGCYAMKPSDYTTFNTFFDKVIREYHGDETGEKKHETDWDASTVGKEGVLDVREIGMTDELSMRVRVGRNLSKFPLPGMMTKEDRIAFEKEILKAFEVLIADEKFGGAVYSLTPEFGEGEANPNLINDDKYNELVKAHVMFKDMDADTFLKSAGISSDWPYGRGCWQSADGTCIVWFGEEDQLRIMCMQKGFCLNEVFDKLKVLLDAIESIDGIDFAKDENYGYVTSCPSNLGTGMRASVHIKLPKLCKKKDQFQAIADQYHVQIRGIHGEHTETDDGTYDISNKRRLGRSEQELVQDMIDGVRAMIEAEKACE